MARKAKPKAEAATNNESNNLLTALKYVSIAQRGDGDALARHVIIENNRISASDGTFTAGSVIKDTGMLCAPNSALLRAALERCDGALAVTHVGDGLTVQQGRFRASVPCLDVSEIPRMDPDAPIAPNDYTPLAEGFRVLQHVVVEKSQKAAFETVLVNGGNMVATNGHVLMEYWHGLNFPNGVVIPRTSLKALAQINKKCVNIGYVPERSITFWFDDESWFKTQLNVVRWPDWESIMKNFPDPSWMPQVSDELRGAIQCVAPFCTEAGNWLVIDAKGVRDLRYNTEYTLDTGAGTKEIGISPEYATLIMNGATNADFFNSDRYVYFIGKNVRGICAYMKA